MKTKKSKLIIPLIIGLSHMGYSQTVITVDKTRQFQTIDGFGAMAEDLPNWGQFRDMSDSYIDMFVNDLGCTIFRTAIDGTMETTNDNNDPRVMDLTKFSLGEAPGGCLGDYHIPISYQIRNLRSLKAKVEANGEQAKFFGTIFSPPAWMKYVDCIRGGDNTWNRLINSVDETEKGGTGEVIKDRTDELAEFSLAYHTLLKNAGLDLYGFSIQNEPRFAQQGFSSCVYTPNSFAYTLGVVAKRLRDEGFNSKMIFTEDIGDLGQYRTFINAILNNTNSAPYADIAAIHSYAANAITPESSDSKTWEGLDRISRIRNANRQFWQTETSGYPDTHAGGIQMAIAIFTALKYGKVNAWVFLGMTRPVREQGSQHESLVLVNGQKSDRYHAAKHFYKYIRPGSIMVSSAESSTGVLSVAFQNNKTRELTMVLINPSTTEQREVNINFTQTTGVPTQFDRYLTTSSQKFVSLGSIGSNQRLTLPASSVLTLVGANSLPEAPASNEDAVSGGNASKFNIYPNPSNAEGFYIEPSENTLVVDPLVKIVNAQGQEVMSFKIESSDKAQYLNTQGLTNGVYMVKFNNTFQKLVVNKD